MKTKKHINKLNVTKKCMPKQKDLKVYCRKHANTFNQFEKEYEKTFTKGLEEENAFAEKELKKIFKVPFMSTRYKPQQD